MNQNSEAWRHYYAKSLARKHPPRTESAAQLNNSGLKIAIDCGCGTGSDIAYLVQQGYRVHGFDMNEDAVAICRERFAYEPLVDISQASFESFSYPQSGLMIANSSLFFADPTRFSETWHAISSSLASGGVFAGDFMGPKDDWAVGFRIPTTPLAEHQVLELFADFEIVRCRERNEPGETAMAKMKHWHTFSVVAIKRA